MRQRLLYATTLLRDPPVMIIDEPLIGLDPYTIRTIRDILRQRGRDGRVVFFTTHILALAAEIADRIGVIHQGRMVALGTLAQLTAAHGAQGLEDLFIKLTGGKTAAPPHAALRPLSPAPQSPGLSLP
jgi:ABC-2 type transport system ATP-binding protein